MGYPKITFDIPTYNAEKHLAACLNSIRRQKYPKEKLEILVADGGSEDRTVEIAKEFGARVFDNPRRLADYGAKINTKNATGDLFVVFAADNELGSENWAKKVARIFNKNKDVVAVWGKIISGEDDHPINKYYELIQNDPFTNFVNKNLDGYLKAAERQSVEGEELFVFNLTDDKPLIWGANGLVYKLEAVKDIILQDEFVADNDVFQIMIERGDNKVAYMPSLKIYHHHLENLKDWISKWKRNYIEHFLTKRKTRNLNWAFTKDFQSKLLLWLIYSLAPIFSSVDTIYKIIKDRNFYWIYHPLACFVQSITYGYLTLFTKSGRMMVYDLISGRLFSKNTEHARSLATENGNKPILIAD